MNATVPGAGPPAARNPGLQALRGLAAVGVFLVHAMLIEQKYGSQKYGGGAVLIGSAGWLGSFGVDLFFALSGFIMVSITRGRFQDGPHAARFLVERLARVYPAYWLVSAAVLLVYLASPQLINAAQGGRIDLLASFLLLPQNILPLLSVGWTLVHELYFYLVFAALLPLLPERHLGWALLAWAAGVVGLDAWRAGDESRPWLTLACDPLTLNFIAGAGAALAVPRLQARDGAALRGLGLALLGLALLALGLWLVPVTLDTVFLDRRWRALVCAVPAALLTLGATLAGPHLPLPGLAGWARLGDVSYSFYLVHLLVLSLAGKLWSALGRPTTAQALLVFAAAFAVCLVLAAAGHRWVEQPTQRWGKRLARRIEAWLRQRQHQQLHPHQPRGGTADAPASPSSETSTP